MSVSSGDLQNSGDDKLRIAKCIREVGNWSKVQGYHLLDRKAFLPDILATQIPEASPKLDALFKKIEQLDQKDMKKYGNHFKHMIFTDVSNSSYSSKIIASAFIAKGYNPAFTGSTGHLRLIGEDRLSETKNNFSILVSKPIFDTPMKTHFKKTTLKLFNQRPENIHGDICRFIILDQGFKEGIDLFDVKYVHLFEPLVVRADEKQAIGRSTRFCGQSGLSFHPRYGWPLYVFRYEIGLDPELKQKYNARQLMELYLQFSDIDLRKVVFAAEIEKASIEGATDKLLTQNIHQFTIDLPPPILSDQDLEQIGGIPITRAKAKANLPLPPQKVLNHNDMDEFIAQRYRDFVYDKVNLKNGCTSTGGSREIVEFTPTQNFVRHYFQPSSAYKGMLLFHSVGTGKTCTGIATATTSFENAGYIILWVTRHTLKTDIWKNMYDKVCSISLQEKIKKGELRLPSKISGPMKYVSSNWVEPISYKQFSNLLLKKNKVYEEMVRRNGKADPLKKTLVIIDEAHKLYAPNVTGAEKPRVDILEKMIQKSYTESGKDSVRILLMTATPLTEDGMEMIKLLNLLRPSVTQFPTNFNKFSKTYLDEQGFFTDRGLTKYKNAIAGYISYLNRSQDARNFSYPVLEEVVVPLSLRQERNPEDKKNIYTTKMKELAKEKQNIRQERKLQLEEISAEKKGMAADQKQMLANIRQCCKSNIQQDFEKKMNEIKLQKDDAKIKHKQANDECMQRFVKQERKLCKDEAKENYKNNMANINVSMKNAKDMKTDKIKECAKLTSGKSDNDILLKREQNVKNEAVEKINKIDANIGDIKRDYDDIKQKKKASSSEKKELSSRYSILKKAIKIDETAKKSELKELKAIKDTEQKKARRKQIVEKYAQLKDNKHEAKELRDKILKLKKSNDLLSQQIGTKFSEDMSQETALQTRCFHEQSST